MNAIMLAERLAEMKAKATEYRRNARNCRGRAERMANNGFDNIAAKSAARAEYYRGMASAMDEAVAMIKGQ